MPAAPTIVRRLTVAQGLAVAGSTVDLTLTGIVGSRIAPTPTLATLPFSLIFLAAGLSTFAVSRAIGTFGHRAVFIAAGLVAVLSGCVSAAGIQLGHFWLFCVGTALIGVYQATTGYYRYLAADSMPEERARAITSVLAGGLVAAIVGPFLATWLRDLTATPYVASYLLVAVLGAAAAGWNSMLPRGAAREHGDGAGSDTSEPARPSGTLWRQPALLSGVAAAALAAATMMTMMTAGPILGLAAGRSAAEAAFAIQLHMIGMYAPGFFVARAMARVGERVVAVAGCAVITVAGVAAATSTALPAYLVAMFAVGVGWNLAYGGGSALIAGAYRPRERGRVQPVAEALILAAQVGGSFSAVAFTSVVGWHALGWGCLLAAAAVAAALVIARSRVQPLLRGASGRASARDEAV